MAAVLKWMSFENNARKKKKAKKKLLAPDETNQKEPEYRVMCAFSTCARWKIVCVCVFILVWQFILCIQLKAIVWKNEVLQSFFGFCCLWLLLWPFCISCECESLFCIEEHSFLFNHVCDFRKFMLKIRTMKIDKRKYETLLYAWNCFLLKLIGCNKFCNLIY